MYRWRKMSPEQRQETLAHRKLQHHPKHSPRHHEAGKGLYLVTSTCYEHQPWIGANDNRMDWFTTELLEVLANHAKRVDAWAILPNHYHVVVLTDSCPVLLRNLARLHGRSSFLWNGEDAARGRKVWFNSLEREISGDGHHMAAIHYVHHNPVKHGYVKKWNDWKWSSARDYLDRLGREEVERRWKEYPLLNFGVGWDD
jgi:putative transposase